MGSLIKLVKNKIINSVKGPSGGFEVSLQHLNTITLGHIVFAIDGTELVTQCGLGLKACNEAKPCPVHHKFKIVRNQLQQMLETTSLKEMVTGMKNGNVYLKL